MESTLVNRVANSGIITIDLEQFFPPHPIVVFDLKDYLFHGLILREKDFREALSTHDWTQYEGKFLTIHCSTDAIIPMWAYQLVVVYAEPHAANVTYGDTSTFIHTWYYQTLAKIDLAQYEDKRIVIKGCSDKPVPPGAYTELTRLLRPIAKSIMFGEPCSTVPLYKKG